MKKESVCLIIPAILLIHILFSCNKNDSSSLNVYSGPVIRKWNIVRHIDTTVFFNGPTTYIDYQPATGGDYLDFRAEGKLYRFENGVTDTSTFTLSNDSLVVTHKYAPIVTTFIIEVSTTDSLQLNGVSYVINNSHDYRKTHYYLNN